MSDASGLLRAVERTDMYYPEPDRNPRRVRAGSYELEVTNGPGGLGGTRKVRLPIHIHTTRVMSHSLAKELRSRAHALVTIEEAAAS